MKYEHRFANDLYILSLHPPIHAGLDDYGPLTINTDMVTIVRAMASPDSGLDIRDRMWLKITIHNAFIGKIVKALFSF